MLRLLRRLFSRVSRLTTPWEPERGFVVTMDESGVRCRRPDGAEESVGWDGLQAVILETNDTGPIGIDVLWVMVGTDSGCVIPMGASGSEGLLRRLQQLPGFDNEAVIRASSCAENRQFLCWQKPRP